MGRPAVPSVVLDSQNVKLCECDSDDIAQMICSLPDLAEVVIAFITNPRDPTLQERAKNALAKFDAIGPYAPKHPSGTE